MRTDDAYEQWKASRGDADVPAGFADRVMERIGRDRQPMPGGTGTAPTAWLPRAAVAAAIVGAIVVWGCRAAVLVAALLASD